MTSIPDSAVHTDIPQVGEHRRRRLPRPELQAWALPALLVVIFVFFSLWPKTAAVFPTTANLQVVAASQAILAIIALAAVVPLVCGQWDLSVGATAGTSAVFTAAALSDGWPLALALALALAIGVVVGSVNALLVTRVGTNAVITTLGTSAILAGVINQRTGGTALVSDIPEIVTAFGSGKFLGIPNTVLVMLVVALVAYFVLVHTPFGRYLYALGSNPDAARLMGLRTRALLGSTFVAAGCLAAFAGALYVAFAGGADPRVGDGFTLPALAAAFLSAAAIKPGRYNVGGVLVAIFFVATINSGLNIAGAPPYVSSYVNGAALIAGVALAVRFGPGKRGV